MRKSEFQGSIVHIETKHLFAFLMIFASAVEYFIKRWIYNCFYHRLYSIERNYMECKAMPITLQTQHILSIHSV